MELKYIINKTYCTRNNCTKSHWGLQVQETCVNNLSENVMFSVNKHENNKVSGIVSDTEEQGRFDLREWISRINIPSQTVWDVRCDGKTIPTKTYQW